MQTFSSYDEHSDLFSLMSSQGGSNLDIRENLRDLISASPEFILRYFFMLPQIDYQIARMYYLEKLSQNQISNILNITQAAVSRRLKYILVRIRFILRMPEHNPIQVREDFHLLFPEELFEFAFFFYWEYSQNRVKFFVKTSQSGAANKFLSVMHFLEEISAIADIDIEGDFAAQQKKCLALVYYDYFRYTRNKSNTISALFKANDTRRTGSLVQGPKIWQ